MIHAHAQNAYQKPRSFNERFVRHLRDELIAAVSFVLFCFRMLIIGFIAVFLFLKDSPIALLAWVLVLPAAAFLVIDISSSFTELAWRTFFVVLCAWILYVVVTELSDGHLSDLLALRVNTFIKAFGIIFFGGSYLTIFSEEYIFGLILVIGIIIFVKLDIKILPKVSKFILGIFGLAVLYSIFSTQLI